MNRGLKEKHIPKIFRAQWQCHATLREHWINKRFHYSSFEDKTISKHSISKLWNSGVVFFNVPVEF